MSTTLRKIKKHIEWSNHMKAISELKNLVKENKSDLIITDQIDKIITELSSNSTISIGELITRGLYFRDKFEIGTPSTRKTYRARLETNIRGLGTVEEIFKSIGVYTTADICRDKMFELYKTLNEKVHNLNYITGIMASLRRVIEWGMKEGYVETDETLLSLCRQKQLIDRNILCPSKLELSVLETKPLGKSRLVAVQMYFIISVLMIRLGLRSAEEVVKLNLEDLDLKGRTIWVHRKGGTYQPIEFSKELVPLFRYMKWIRYLHLKKYNATDERAFIIKFNNKIKGIGKDANWRLSSMGLIARWRHIRRKLQLEEFRKLYHFRKLSVSIQAKVGRIMGMAVADIAFRNDHSRDVFNKHYNVQLHDKSEFLSRDLKENVEFIKERLFECNEKIRKEPNNIEHRASYKRWYDRLGDFQNEIDIDEYRGSDKNFTSFGFPETMKGISSRKKATNHISFNSRDNDCEDDAAALAA